MRKRIIQTVLATTLALSVCLTCLPFALSADSDVSPSIPEASENAVNNAQFIDAWGNSSYDKSTGIIQVNTNGYDNKNAYCGLDLISYGSNSYYASSTVSFDADLPFGDSTDRHNFSFLLGKDENNISLKLTMRPEYNQLLLAACVSESGAVTGFSTGPMSSLYNVKFADHSTPSGCYISKTLSKTEGDVYNFAFWLNGDERLIKVWLNGDLVISGDFSDWSTLSGTITPIFGLYNSTVTGSSSAIGVKVSNIRIWNDDIAKNSYGFAVDGGENNFVYANETGKNQINITGSSSSAIVVATSGIHYKKKTVNGANYTVEFDARCPAQYDEHNCGRISIVFAKYSGGYLSVVDRSGINNQSFFGNGTYGDSIDASDGNYGSLTSGLAIGNTDPDNFHHFMIKVKDGVMAFWLDGKTCGGLNSRDVSSYDAEPYFEIRAYRASYEIKNIRFSGDLGVTGIIAEPNLEGERNLAVSYPYNVSGTDFEYNGSNIDVEGGIASESKAVFNFPFTNKNSFMATGTVRFTKFYQNEDYSNYGGVYLYLTEGTRIMIRNCMNNTANATQVLFYDESNNLTVLSSPFTPKIAEKSEQETGFTIVPQDVQIKYSVCYYNGSISVWINGNCYYLNKTFYDSDTAPEVQFEIGAYACDVTVNNPIVTGEIDEDVIVYCPEFGEYDTNYANGTMMLNFDNSIEKYNDSLLFDVKSNWEKNCSSFGARYFACEKEFSEKYGMVLSTTGVYCAHAKVHFDLLYLATDDDGLLGTEFIPNETAGQSLASVAFTVAKFAGKTVSVIMRAVGASSTQQVLLAIDDGNTLHYYSTNDNPVYYSSGNIAKGQEFDYTVRYNPVTNKVSFWLNGVLVINSVDVSKSGYIGSNLKPAFGIGVNNCRATVSEVEVWGGGVSSDRFAVSDLDSLLKSFVEGNSVTYDANYDGNTDIRDLVRVKRIIVGQ